MLKTPYVFAQLHNNDFSSQLVKAVAYVAGMASENTTEDGYKECVLTFLMAHELISNKCRGIRRDSAKSKQTLDYLIKKLQIVYMNDEPLVDHDNGSAVCYVPTCAAWSV